MQAGARVKSADVVDGLLYGIDGTADGPGDVFVLFALQSAQVLVDDGDGIVQDLRGAVTVFVSVLVKSKLLLVMVQLSEQAFAKSATADTGRIELADDFECFLEIGGGEVRFLDGTRRRGNGSGSSGCGGISIA